MLVRKLFMLFTFDYRKIERVREASMTAIQVFTSLVVKHDPSLLNPET